jgi:hypothetical protein
VLVQVALLLGLFGTVTTIVDRGRADLWVVDAGTRSFDLAREMPRRVETLVRAQAGRGGRGPQLRCGEHEPTTLRRVGGIEHPPRVLVGVNEGEHIGVRDLTGHDASSAVSGSGSMSSDDGEVGLRFRFGLGFMPRLLIARESVMSFIAKSGA